MWVKEEVVVVVVVTVAVQRGTRRACWEYDNKQGMFLVSSISICWLASSSVSLQAFQVGFISFIHCVLFFGFCV